MKPTFIISTFLLLIIQFEKKELRRTVPQKEVTLEQFGCKGNGQDETEMIEKAFAYAKKEKLPVKLLGKTYIFSPKSTLNITGIPSITGTGTLDLSKTGKAAGNPAMNTIFHVEGEKKLIQKKVKSLTRGQREIILEKNLSLNKNDILFISSAEPLENTKRPYYCKGQRVRVKSYTPSTGIVQLTDTLSYSIQSSYIWKLSNEPVITVTKGVRFITSPMNFITCFRLYYARGMMSGYYKNFALTAIMFKSSSGEVNEMEADLPVTDNNGYSHCVEVADMSDVIIRNSILTGGRHVISGVGGGLWEKEESGGKGHAGYPSDLEVDGGTYKGMKRANDITEHNATLDSHGLISKMIIRNCTIYGGINLGANYVLVENVTIYADEKRILNVGSDVSENADWGNYTIQNSHFIGDKKSNISLIYGKANVQSLTLSNISVDNQSGSAYLLDFRYFGPKKMTIDNLHIKEMPNRPLLISRRKEGIMIRDSDLKMNQVKWMD